MKSFLIICAIFWVVLMSCESQNTTKTPQNENQTNTSHDTTNIETKVVSTITSATTTTTYTEIDFLDRKTKTYEDVVSERCQEYLRANLTSLPIDTVLFEDTKFLVYWTKDPQYPSEDLEDCAKYYSSLFITVLKRKDKEQYFSIHGDFDTLEFAMKEKDLYLFSSYGNATGSTRLFLFDTRKDILMTSFLTEDDYFDNEGKLKNIAPKIVKEYQRNFGDSLLQKRYLGLYDFSQRPIIVDGDSALFYRKFEKMRQFLKEKQK